MRLEQAGADVKLIHGDNPIELKGLVDTDVSKSIISKGLADRLSVFIPLSEPYELRTVDEGGRLSIVGRCMVDVVFQGVKVPSGEVAENLRKDVEIVIGRPEIDS